MPLLMSPIDGQPMRQVNRYGIELDVCASSGGIWLDKGELEKLLAIIREETLKENGDAAAYAPHPPQIHGGYVYNKRDDDDDDDDRRHHRHEKDRYYKDKPKGKMSRVLDIFDF
jgi:Zn-finger nucleic acid-binding protein